MSTSVGSSHEMPGIPGAATVSLSPEHRFTRTLLEAFPHTERYKNPRATKIKIFSVPAEMHKMGQKHLGDLHTTDYQHIAAKGTALWLEGLLQGSPLSERINQEERIDAFADVFPQTSRDERKQRVGSSAFSAYVDKVDGKWQFMPDARIAGGWSEVAQFAEHMQKEYGVEIWMDALVHTSYDSPVVKESPWMFVHRTKPPEAWQKHLFPEEPTTVVHGTPYWVAYGRWSNGAYGEQAESWRDLAPLNIANEEARRLILDHAKKIGRFASGFRVDAAALWLSDVFRTNWGDYAEFSREELQFLDEARRNPRKELLAQVMDAAQEAAGNRGVSFRAIGEIFGNYQLEGRQHNVDRVREILGRIYYVGRRYEFIDVVNAQRDDRIQWLAQSLQDTMSDLQAHGVVYFGDQDNDPTAGSRVVGDIVKARMLLLMSTMLPGIGLIGPMEEEGYQGAKWDVQCKQFPTFPIDVQTVTAMRHAMTIAKSDLFQDPTSTTD
ncbi:MAG: hypothetical protein KGL95_10810, partial [Patescibacteria group bacterium]|nr:hypothetical protein [Patescibacteria group bacterium]